MRRPILFALVLLLSQLVSAQKLYPLRVLDDSIPFQITTQNGKLELRTPTATEVFNSKKDFPTLIALRLEGSDLVLEYQPQKTADILSYDITLRLQLADGQTINPLAYELSNVEQAGGTSRLVWLDAVEYLPDFSAGYSLHVRRSLMGAVNCEGRRPTFSLKKQLPHYAAGSVGLVLVGLGQVYRDQRDTYYSDYQKNWADGLPVPDDKNNKQKTAVEKNRNASICTWTGLAILGVDALLFVWRGQKIKKKQRVYDKFCGTSTSFNLRPVLMPGAGLGLGISCSW